MSGSEAEREIRDFAAAFLRRQRPAARIVHELVVEDCRADIAAIETERVVLVEIKSSKDTLTRLSRQVSRFTAAAHMTIVIADKRWFEEFDYTGGGRGYRPTRELTKLPAPVSLLRYPEPKEGEFTYKNHWQLRDHPRPEPHAAKLLGLLWKGELLAEAARHRIVSNSRSTVSSLIKDMVWMMTGREIALAVCRQLRARPFPEADAPILEAAA